MMCKSRCITTHRCTKAYLLSRFLGMPSELASDVMCVCVHYELPVSHLMKRLGMSDTWIRVTFLCYGVQICWLLYEFLSETSTATSHAKSILLYVSPYTSFPHVSRSRCMQGTKLGEEGSSMNTKNSCMALCFEQSYDYSSWLKSV